MTSNSQPDSAPPARRRSIAAALSGVLALAGVALVVVGTPGCDKGPTGAVKPITNSGTPEGLKEQPKESELSQERRGPPAFRFEDVAAACGITAMNHSGTAGVKEYLVEAVGPGPACLDYDRDGLMDFYVPDGDVFSNYDL